MPQKTDTTETSAMADFIIPFEGFSATPYGDYKQQSIGYGTKALSADDYVTKPEARTRLLRHLNTYVLPTLDKYKFLNRNQRIALSSFLYNIGSMGTSFKKYLSSQDYASLSATWQSYVNAGGKKLEHLEKRRSAEFKLFMS